MKTVKPLLLDNSIIQAPLPYKQFCALQTEDNKLHTIPSSKITTYL